jgi:hypothetical protein
MGERRGAGLACGVNVIVCIASKQPNLLHEVSSKLAPDQTNEVEIAFIRISNVIGNIFVSVALSVSCVNMRLHPSSEDMSPSLAVCISRVREHVLLTCWRCTFPPVAAAPLHLPPQHDRSCSLKIDSRALPTPIHLTFSQTASSA